jgi:hypothetical protein
MSDLPYNNNAKDECFYCSHLYTFHFSSSSPDGNIQEDNSIESKKDPHDDNPKGCSFVNNFNKSSCNCPGFRSSLSSITN